MGWSVFGSGLVVGGGVVETDFDVAGTGGGGEGMHKMGGEKDRGVSGKGRWIERRSGCWVYSRSV